MTINLFSSHNYTQHCKVNDFKIILNRKQQLMTTAEENHSTAQHKKSKIMKNKFFNDKRNKRKQEMNEITVKHIFIDDCR